MVSTRHFTISSISTWIIFVVQEMAAGERYDPLLAIQSILIDRIVYLIDGWLALFEIKQDFDFPVAAFIGNLDQDAFVDRVV